MESWIKLAESIETTVDRGHFLTLSQSNSQTIALRKIDQPDTFTADNSKDQLPARLMK
jgi:hypothetical protein